MARINDALLLGVVGKVGRLVVVNRQGMEYVRFQPRTKSALPSPKQQLVQSRLKNAMTFISAYKDYACKHFGKREGHKNQYNRAVNNLLQSFLLEYQNHSITINYAMVTFSKGELLPIEDYTMIKTGVNALQINWHDNSGANPNRQTDELQILIAPQDEYQTFFMRNVAPRQAQTYDLEIPTTLQNKTLHIYAGFLSQDQSQASNSIYLGSIN